MEHIVVYARLESIVSTKDPPIKMIRLEVGMSYECFVNDILKRFNLQCDPCNVKLMFRPKISWDSPVPITDDYDLNQYMSSIQRGDTEPSLTVRVTGSDPSFENLGSDAFVCSNNVKIIYPTPPTDEWFAGVESAEVKVLPPVIKLRKGRKKTKRMPSVGEFGRPPKKRKRCSKCRREGHYVKKCPEKDSGNTI